MPDGDEVESSDEDQPVEFVDNSSDGEDSFASDTENEEENSEPNMPLAGQIQSLAEMASHLVNDQASLPLSFTLRPVRSKYIGDPILQRPLTSIISVTLAVKLSSTKIPLQS